MRKLPDAKGLIDSVLRLARKNPEFIYSKEYSDGGCRYVDESGNGMCLLGRAMIENGLDPEVFSELSPTPAGTEVPANENLFRAIAKTVVDEISREEISALQLVQFYQDGDEPWRYAVGPLRRLVGL